MDISVCENQNKLPSHVGIIMDGNGRWATLRKKERSYGHKAGSNNVEKIATCAFKKGIKVLTLYAFSAENWARPQKEVDELMRLIKVYFTKFIKKTIKKEVRLVVIGDKSKLSDELNDIISESEKLSAKFTEHVLVLAINYGGRQEIVYAVNRLMENKREITVDNISSELYTAEFGAPDLIIRTGGEKRLSNFLLFQGAYSELYFTDVLWPDFDAKDFDAALEEYSKRNRRFGKV